MDIKNVTKTLTEQKADYEEGHWFDTSIEGLRLKIASVYSDRYTRRLTHEQKKRRGQIRAGGLVGEKATDESENIAMAYALILDWEGPEEKNKPLDYDPRIVIGWLQNKKFKLELQGYSIEVGEAVEGEVIDDAGNSQITLVGT